MRAIKEDVTAVDEDSYSGHLSRSGGYGFGHSRSKDALENSVREQGRDPVKIKGITTFLQEEYRDKYGIFCDNSQSLLKFWKDHVSSYYKLRADRIKAT